MTTFDFGFGPVSAHRHPNGGGWVADTARVAGNALVFGYARVSGNARIYGIMRSDDYCFVAVPCADGEKRIIAGCRYFTLAEAKKHWNKTHWDYKEVSAILQFFITTGQL